MRYMELYLISCADGIYDGGFVCLSISFLFFAAFCFVPVDNFYVHSTY